MNQEWKAEPAQIEAFINTTNLVPVAMLDSVTDGVVCHLKDDARAEEIYEVLRGQETIDYIEGRSALVFANNAPFRKNLLVKDPRSTYRGFVQHWVSSLIQKKFPVQFRKLPSGFSMGSHL